MAQILINFDRSLTNLQRTGQRFRGTFFCQIFVKIVELMDKKHEILHRGQTYPALQKTSKQRFCQWPIPWCKYLFIHKKQIKIKSKLKVKSKYLDLKLQ